MIPKVVIAGNHDQFVHWCEQNDFEQQEFLYITNIHQLENIYEFFLFEVGTYEENLVHQQFYSKIIKYENGCSY